MTPSIKLLATLYCICVALCSGKGCKVTDYGAKGDNNTLDTDAIQSAIVDSDGARSLVLLPSLSATETVYVAGALWLESNLEFRIEANVRLLGTANKSNATFPFIYTRYDGTMNMTKASLLNGGICTKLDYNSSAIGDQCRGNWKTLTNVKISGAGIIDGNG